MKLAITSFLLLSGFAQSKEPKTKTQKLAKTTNKALRHKHVAAESRIVGGNVATPGDYPFFVQWEGCGASLIHEDIILSAAHCNPITNNSVLIGAYQSSSQRNGAETRSIVTRSRHPGYNDYTVENDFLVMKLDQASTKSPVAFNTDQNLPYDNEQLTVMGFGALYEGDYYGSTVLHQVNINAVPHDKCSAQYNGEIVEDVMLCAGVPGGGKDSCQGDSGGPIIDSNGAQVGIVSWGYGCGQPQFPGVYARTSGAVDWINAQICELSDNPPDFCGDIQVPVVPEPADGAVRVQMTFTLDDYPQEVGLLVTSSDGEIVVEYPTGSFSDYGGVFTGTEDLIPGDYQLKFTDTYGDGFCCGFGEGRFEIHALLDGDVLLAEVDGVFADSLLVEFSVPAPSPSPGPNNGCQDEIGTFLVDSEVGDADCAWLSVNHDRYNYLCQFLDVAVTCPNTCDACEYFE